MKKIIYLFCFLSCCLMQQMNAQCDFTFTVINNPSATCAPNDGQYVIEVSGADFNKTLEYSRDDGNSWQTSHTFNSVPGGFHTILVRYTDESCTSDPFADFMEEYAPPTLQSVNKTDATNCTANGSIIINATGDKTLMYSIDGINWQSNGSFNNIYGGDYVPQVQYELGAACTQEQTMTLNGTAAPVITNVVVLHPSSSDDNGRITVTTNAITGSLSYRVNGGGWSSSPVIDNLAAGNYTLEVRNIHNASLCITNYSTVVLDGSLAIGDQTFEYQSEIDDFLNTHPNVIQINGDITIRTADLNNDPIQNLNGLSQINYVEGFLRISGNRNSNFTTLSGLSNLNSVGGYLYIRVNNALSSLNGLEHLNSVGGYLDIGYNDALSSLSGLENLNSVGGNLSISYNNALSSLSGLENLNSVGGYLSISFNDALSSLSSLENLNSVGGDLSISFNDALSSLSSLENLNSVGGSLSISFNDALSSLSGLENLNSVGGSLSISSNDALSSLSSLENLNSVGGYLSIRVNNALSSLSGLENLNSVEGYLSIRDNNALSSLSGLENLNSVGGYLSISSNDALSSLSGLENLNSVGGYLFISSNDALSSLSGLENLNSVGGYLDIRFNNALSSLSGLENLNSVEGYLSISDNNALSSLSGLGNLVSIGENITIKFNSNLSICAIEPICNYIANNSNVSSYIYDNAHGCNDQSFNSGENDFASACNCLPNGITLDSQAEINEFKNDYPGCAIIRDFLHINGQSGVINNLHGLDGIVSVRKALTITDTEVTNLSGLHNLTFVGEGLSISNNSTIENLQGLESLKSTSDESIINDNPNLTSLNGLEELTTVNQLYIYRNPQLNDISGLSNLTTINDLLLDDNDALTAISGLDQITHIGGPLAILNNDALTSLQGLHQLNTVNGDVQVQGNNMLTSLSGLDQITAIGGDFLIENNANLSFCAIAPICNGITSTDFANNSTGCNSNAEVEAACNALSVNLLSFTAKQSTDQIHLNWQTTTETHLSHYEIEHSLNGKDFDYLGKVAATNNHQSVQSYQFIHEKPTATVHYYRLKIVEESGASDYSNVISIALENDKTETLVFSPNPANGMVQIAIPKRMDASQPLEVAVFNSLGQQVLSTQLTEPTLDIADLPKGIYVVKVQQAVEVVSGQLVKF